MKQRILLSLTFVISVCLGMGWIGELRPVGAFVKDVTPVEILEPSEYVIPDSSYTPRVIVANLGSVPVSFDLTFEIKHGPSGLLRYHQNYSVQSLGVDEERELVFSHDWTVGDSFVWYYLIIHTKLAGDIHPGNDTILDSCWSCWWYPSMTVDTKLPECRMLSNGRNISLVLEKELDGKLDVFDVMGRRYVLHEGIFDAGEHRFDLTRQEFPGGLYFIRFRAPGIELKRKIIVIE